VVPSMVLYSGGEVYLFCSLRQVCLEKSLIKGTCTY
jgi:hypothetical protein